MSDPSPCVAQEWGPCAPYLTADTAAALGCSCQGLDLNDEADAALYGRALVWASRRLFEATGRVYTGCCTSTVRPISVACADLRGVPVEFAQQYLPPAIPVVVGQDANGPLLVNCWTCPSSAGLATLLALPYLPVREVLRVEVNGEDLDPAAWRLRPGTNLLARIDGAPFPIDQDPDADLGADGTWGVEFRWGWDLPPEALPLLNLFACELTKLCRGGECQLAPGVRIVSRPGVEYDEVVVGDADGLTGFGPLDDWIRLQRGGHTTIQPRIYVPGHDRPSPFLGG